MPINVGMIGYGLSAKVFHIPFVDHLPDYKLHSVLQRSGPKSHDDKEHVSIARPDVVWHRTEDEFFADDKLDLVIVGTPTDTHSPLATKALKAGKHVVVEKPFVPTSEEADALISLAKEQGKVLTVFQNRRLDGDYLTLQKLLPKLGYVHDLETNFDRYRPEPPRASWKVSGPGTGLVYDLGSHLLDQVLQLFGPPETIYCTSPDPLLNFTMILTFEKGKRVVTAKSTTISCVGVQPRYRARGVEGSYVKFGEDPQENQRRQATPMSLDDASFGMSSSDVDGTFTTRNEVEGGSKDAKTGFWEKKVPTEKGTYIKFHENVAKAIRGEAELDVKPEQSRDVIKLIELGRKSIAEGKVVTWES